MKHGEALVWHAKTLTEVACTGGPAFEYQSCTQQQDLVGSMEGAFKFVEGSLASPTGPFFDVQVCLCHAVILSAMHPLRCTGS